MLELRAVSKHYAGIPAVDQVSFCAKPGEVTGYLGPNGSGKSTTMKMVTGLIEMTSGEILFDGQPIDRDPITYKQRMGYVPEEPYLYPHLTGLEYLVMVGQLRDLPAKRTAERIDGLLHLFSLHGERHVPLSSYSKGMRQKILLSAALLHNPDLILLDEPFSGLDVASALVMRSLIQELAARGKVVLFSSHELETVERVCTHVIILQRAKVVADDSILVASQLIMIAAVMGTRVSFAMPLEIRANWIFRVLPLPGTSKCLEATRRSLYALAAPVWLALAALLFWLWPWRTAAEHVVVLALIGFVTGEWRLYGFYKIPFTCSYQPGKSHFNMAALAAVAAVFLLEKAAAVELAALRSPVLYAGLVAGLSATAVLCWRRTRHGAQSETLLLDFDDNPEPLIMPLGLHRDGVMSIRS